MTTNNPSAFNGKEIEFPVQYQIKIIMNTTRPDEVNKNDILRVFNQLNIPNHDWKHRHSKEGSYISFTVNIIVNDKKTYDQLYKDLKSLPDVKWAV